MVESAVTACVGFLQRRWLILLLVPAIALALVYVRSGRSSDTFEATSTLLISPAAAVNTPERPGDSPYAPLTATFASLVTRPSVLDEVRARLSLPATYTNAELLSRLDVRPIGGTLLLSIRAQDERAETAIALSNVTAIVFSESSAVELAPWGTATVVLPAPAASAVPAGLSLMLLALVGAGAAVGGVVVALMVDRLRRDDDEQTAFEWPPVDQPMPAFAVGAPAQARGAVRPGMSRGQVAPSNSFLADLLQKQGAVENPGDPNEQHNVPAVIQATEVAPPAMAPARQSPPSETTTLIAKSHSPGEVTLPGPRFLKDEDLRPNTPPEVAQSHWRATVQELTRPVDEAVVRTSPIALSDGEQTRDTCPPVPRAEAPCAEPEAFATVELSETMVELLGRLDKTVDMIRALRPSEEQADRLDR